MIRAMFMSLTMSAHPILSDPSLPKFASLTSITLA